MCHPPARCPDWPAAPRRQPQRPEPRLSLLPACMPLPSPRASPMPSPLTPPPSPNRRVLAASRRRRRRRRLLSPRLLAGGPCCLHTSRRLQPVEMGLRSAAGHQNPSWSLLLSVASPPPSFPRTAGLSPSPCASSPRFSPWLRLVPTPDLVVFAPLSSRPLSSSYPRAPSWLSQVGHPRCRRAHLVTPS